MIHHGDALRALLKREKVTLSGLARKLHVHANTITNWAQSDKIKLDVWRQIATVLKKELSEVVPGMSATAEADGSTVQGSPILYNLAKIVIPETLSDCKQELLRVQTAYIALLQEHLDLVRSLGSTTSPA